MTDDLDEMRNDFIAFCVKYNDKGLTFELSQRLISAGVTFMLGLMDEEDAKQRIKQAVEVGIITHNQHNKEDHG